MKIRLSVSGSGYESCEVEFRSDIAETYLTWMGTVRDNEAILGEVRPKSADPWVHLRFVGKDGESIVCDGIAARPGPDDIYWEATAWGRQFETGRVRRKVLEGIAAGSNENEED
jgi:hypothetical protein